MQYNILIPTLLIIVGIAFLLWAGKSFLNQKKFLSNAVSATGVINGYDYSTSSRAQRDSDTESGVAGHVDVTLAAPKIEFTTQSGEQVSVVAKSSTEAKSGEQVKVLYLPDDPQTAQFDDFFPIWGLTIIFAGFGCVFCLIGVALRFLI